MEYFPKGDLSIYQGYIGEDEAKTITLQLLEGLQIMHKKGFTHRDLKPNVIIHLIFMSLFRRSQQLILIGIVDPDTV
jgi:hypothetical protein